MNNKYLCIWSMTVYLSLHLEKILYTLVTIDVYRLKNNDSKKIFFKKIFPSYREYTIYMMNLIEACDNQDIERVKTLLNDPTINPAVFEVMGDADNIQDVNAMHITSKNGNVEIMKLLLEDGRIDPTQGGYVTNIGFYSPLHISSKMGHVEIVKLLLEDDRVNPNQKDEVEGFTPLMFACIENKIQVVKILLEDDRVNPNQKDEVEGFTPLMFACIENKIQVVKILLSNPRININEVNNGHLDCLYICCINDHHELVEMILTNPGYDKTDCFLLYESYHISCLYNQYEIIKLMIALIDDYKFGATNNRPRCGYDEQVEDILKTFKGSPEYHRIRSKYYKGYYAGNLFYSVVMLSDGYFKICEK